MFCGGRQNHQHRCGIPGGRHVGAAHYLWPAEPRRGFSAIDGDAHHVRFEEWIPFSSVQHGKDFVLRITVENGTTLDTTSVHENARLGDLYYACWSARVHPVWDYPGLRDMQESPAYLATAVIARKTGETPLDWTVPTPTAAPTHYPTGEIPDPSA